jgi:hypothetical protein
MSKTLYLLIRELGGLHTNTSIACIALLELAGILFLPSEH